MVNFNSLKITRIIKALTLGYLAAMFYVKIPLVFGSGLSKHLLQHTLLVILASIFFIALAILFSLRSSHVSLPLLRWFLRVCVSSVVVIITATSLSFLVLSIFDLFNRFANFYLSALFAAFIAGIVLWLLIDRILLPKDEGLVYIVMIVVFVVLFKCLLYFLPTSIDVVMMNMVWYIAISDYLIMGSFFIFFVNYFLFK